VGVPATISIVTQGFPVPGIAVSGKLPAGVTFVDNRDGTGRLAGIAAAGSGGVYKLTVTASNTGGKATQSFTLTVVQAPVITTASAFTFVAGKTATFTVKSSGFPVPALSLSGTLPVGLSFVDNHNGTATLTGKPGAASGGSYPVTITAANSAGTTTQTFTLVVR
jgi:Putative Ig domain